MAITLNFADIQKKHDHNWGTIDDFENYHLRVIQETRPDRIHYTDRYGNEHEIDHIDNFPKLKKYQVWCEGYASNDEGSGATLLGKAYARNFAQACDIVMCTNHLE